jgi:hypothetical protein
MNLSTLRLGVVLALGLFGGGAGAQQAQEATDMHLEDVGFVMRAATTPQLERLRLLPPRQFVARTAGGRRYYLYADPDLCKCVFLGNEAAMQGYRDLVAAVAPAPIGGGPRGAESTLIEEMSPDLSASIAPGDIFDY